VDRVPITNSSMRETQGNGGTVNRLHV